MSIFILSLSYKFNLKNSYLNLAIFRFPYITAILRDIIQELGFKFNIY